ncbi:MAG: aminopeptidase P family protein [Burkholderiales bacterium]|nr:aminopeptidase P family protein [Anaerolineae bacterium]
MQMLTAEGCKARRDKLIASVEADLIVIHNPRHIQYLSGLFVTQTALKGWGSNFLLIDTATGKSRLLVHNHIAGDAHNAHVDDVDEWTWYDAGRNPGIEIFGTAVRELNTRLTSMTTRRVGVEIGWLPLGVNVENTVDVSATLFEMQRQKYDDELTLIREAVHGVGAGHRAARQVIEPGVTELDVYNALQAGIVNEVGHAVLLMGDFASGDRANGGGGEATKRVLAAGELMILDVFPIVNGYRADFTATVSVDGQLSEKQAALEKALHAGIAAGEKMLKPGSVAGDVYRAVQAALADNGGFDKGFRHHAGHGLGLGHPQAPYFVPESRETLIAGDVVTLEPGSYGDDFGARIEHNYLITDSGYERLSNHDTAFVSAG